MKLKITVHGTAYEVDVEVLEAGDELPPPVSPLPRINNGGGGGHPMAAHLPQEAVPTNGEVTSPIAGTVLEITGANRFRVNAHARVARAMKDLTTDVATLADDIAKLTEMIEAME